MSELPPPGFRVERLQPAQERAGFHCGIPELDVYLQRQAGQDSRRTVAAPFVLLDPNGAIAGYYTLSAYILRLSELPDNLSKKLPRYPLLPATLLGRLAIDEKHQGQNLGSLLLLDAAL